MLGLRSRSHGNERMGGRNTGSRDSGVIRCNHGPGGGAEPPRTCERAVHLFRRVQRGRRSKRETVSPAAEYRWGKRKMREKAQAPAAVDDLRKDPRGGRWTSFASGREDPKGRSVWSGRRGAPGEREERGEARVRVRVLGHDWPPFPARWPVCVWHMRMRTCRGGNRGPRRERY